MKSNTSVPVWMHAIAVALIVALVSLIELIVEFPKYVVGGLCGGLGAAWVIYGAPVIAGWRANTDG